MDEPQQPKAEKKLTLARVVGMVLGAALGFCLFLGLNAPEDPAARIGFLGMLFLVMPAASLVSYFHLKRKLPLPPKPKRYLNAIALEVMLLALGLRLAFSLHQPWFRPQLGSVEAGLAGGTMAAAAMLGAYRKWKQPGGIESRLAATLLPVSAGEFLLWTPVALLAGAAEEIVYRGVAVALLVPWTGSLVLAAILSAAAFAMAHVAQGGKAAVGIALFGFTMQIVFFLTGTLYLPMLVHALYDLLLGVMFLWMNRRAAAAPQPAPQPSEG